MKSMKLVLTLCLSLFVSGLAAEPLRIGKTKTIVLIHGLYLTRQSWEPWKTYLEAKGFKVHSPGYPGLDGEPRAIRARHPDAALAKLTLEEVLAHYRSYVSKLDEKPILIGHSMGGLISQILLSEGLAAGAVVLDSAPPKGVVSPATAMFRHGLRFVRNGWGFVSPFADYDTILLSPEQFASEFANGFPAADLPRVYEELSIPASRRQGKGALTDTAKLDFARARGPLLLVAGSEDRIIPPSVVKLNHEAYEKSAGVTGIKEFSGRGHFIGGQPGWEEVADFALKWIEENR